jgi:hypothetical protein
MLVCSVPLPSRQRVDLRWNPLHVDLLHSTPALEGNDICRTAMCFQRVWDALLDGEEIMTAAWLEAGFDIRARGGG